MQNYDPLIPCIYPYPNQVLIKLIIIISPFYLLNQFFGTSNDPLILSFELLAITVLVYFIFQKSLTSIKLLLLKNNKIEFK